MPQAVCVNCEIFLKPKKNGVMAVTTIGCREDRPYEVYHADLWECPKCGVEIVLGFGMYAEMEYWQQGFEKRYNDITEPKYFVHER